MYAKGIPDKHRLGEVVKKVEPGQIYDWIIQKHDAERAGLHYDVRFGNKELGLFSWATKKEMPQPGKPIELFQQPVHAYYYKHFQGTIPFGYGKGTVKKHMEGKILVTHKDDDDIHFSFAQGQDPQRYALIKPNKHKIKSWMLVRANPVQAPEGAKKIKFNLIEKDKAMGMIDKLPEGATVQPKLDGALNFIHLLKDRAEVLSYRTSKRTGGPIVHTERFFGKVPRIDVPKEMVGSVLLAEIYGTRKGKAIQGQELGGLLNAGVAKSLERQKEKDIKMKGMVFDIARYGKDKLPDNMSYDEKRKLMEKVLDILPNNKTFHLPDERRDPKSALELVKQVTSGKHPLTTEGVVIRTPEGKRYKYKSTDEHDVYVRKFFPAEKGSKYEDKAVGGFHFSWTPDGPIVGKVGTGLTDETRKDMHEHPNRYTDRIARVRAHERYPSGALRAPALISMHEG